MWQAPSETAALHAAAPNDLPRRTELREVPFFPQTPYHCGPAALATVLTLLTQHPWTMVTNDSYLIDWFPYSVQAGRVSVAMADLDAVWRPRAYMLAAGLIAFVAWRRSLTRRQTS